MQMPWPFYIDNDAVLQGAWAIRKSTIKDVVRSGNKVTNDFTDKSYSKVCLNSPLVSVC